MKPTKAINSTGRPDWRYTSAAKTDVAASIRAAYRRLAEEDAAKPVAEVRPLRRVRGPSDAELDDPRRGLAADLNRKVR